MSDRKPDAQETVTGTSTGTIVTYELTEHELIEFRVMVKQFAHSPEGDRLTHRMLTQELFERLFPTPYSAPADVDGLSITILIGRMIPQ